MWKTIQEYDNFEISNDGRVRRKDSKGLKSCTKQSNGYISVCLYQNGERKTLYIHRLVAQYFCENPNNYNIVHHKDGNRSNNHYSNLEWTTQSKNMEERNKYKIPHNVRVLLDEAILAGLITQDDVKYLYDI